MVDGMKFHAFDVMSFALCYVLFDTQQPFMTACFIHDSVMKDTKLHTVLTLLVFPLCSASSCMFLRISTGGDAMNTTYGINSDVLIDFKAWKA